MTDSANPEAIIQIDDIKNTLYRVGKIVEPEFTEDEVQMVFLNEGYFSLLGYSDIGSNLKSEVPIGNKFADYVTTGKQFGSNAPAVTVYEFKNPKRKLTRNENQLEEYMTGTGAAHGVLTNGQQFALYEQKRGGINKRELFNLENVTEGHAGVILRELSSLSVEEQELRIMAEAAAEVTANELPRELWEHPGFSEPIVETFADHYAEFLFNELGNHK
jgi:hypothetical protein